MFEIVAMRSLDCIPNGASMPTASLTNIITVRSTFLNPTYSGLLRNCTISNCLSTVGNEPGCTVTQIGMLQFTSPDLAPYDDHINMPSPAIDAGTGGAGTFDFDGDQRPKGTAADIGADEAE